MQQLPIINAASQTLTVNLGGQYCRFTIRTLSTGLFCDVYVNDVLIVGGVICQDRNLLVRNSYLGFIGDLMFIDTQGLDDPSFPGLGARFMFIYLEVADLDAAGYAA